MPDQSDTQLAVTRGAALMDVRKRACALDVKVEAFLSQHSAQRTRADAEQLLRVVHDELRVIMSGSTPAAQPAAQPVVLTEIERAALLLLNGWPGRHPAASVADRKRMLAWSFDQVMRALNTLALRGLVDKDAQSGRFSISDDGQQVARRLS